MRTFDGIVMLVAVLVIVAACCGVGSCAFNGCGPSYASGARTGRVAKLSYKGFMWKCWEGELAVNETTLWEFSVRDESVVKQIQATMDSRAMVELGYHEFLIGPITQDSGHTVESVKVTKP